MSTLPDTKDARRAILGAVSAAIGNNGKSQQDRQSAVTDRIELHKRGIIPARGNVSAPQRADMLAEKVEALSGTTERVKSKADIPKRIAAYLKHHNLPAKIRLGADARFDDLDWSKAPTVSVNHGQAQDPDKVTLTHAISGVAETGTLMMTSGIDNPTTLNFMPEHHIIVVDAATIDPCYEDGFDRLRAHYGDIEMPRVVNFITGPSRTADIEQIIHRGVHGPKHLHVIIAG